MKPARRRYLRSLAHSTALEVQQWADENAQKPGGCICPVCSHVVDYMKRSLNSGQAHSLIWLVKASGPDLEWMEPAKVAPRHVIGNREWDKLRLRGLVEAKMNEDKTKRDSGIWRPTLEGIQFAQGKTTQPEWILVYLNEVLEVSEERVFIWDAMESKFSYEELMSS